MPSSLIVSSKVVAYSTIADSCVCKHCYPRSMLTERELGAWRGLLETHSRIVARLDSELEREHGLSLSSYEVLMYLADADGARLRMGELADRLLLSRSGITRLVDR